jgi:hypothetical protein
MRWTVVSLVRVVLAGISCAAVQGCIDAHADYDDFKARPFAEPVRDSAAPDVPLTMCESILQKDVTGTFFASCLPVVTGTPFGLAVHQTLKVSDAGMGELQISFQLLNIMGTNIDDTVSMITDLPATPISSDCTYDLQIGALTIPNAATTLGGDATAEHVSLHGFLQNEDRACAELDGNVTTPIPLSLNDPGDYCVFRRVAPGSALPIIDMSEYACLFPNADP